MGFRKQPDEIRNITFLVECVALWMGSTHAVLTVPVNTVEASQRGLQADSVFIYSEGECRAQ